MPPHPYNSSIDMKLVSPQQRHLPRTRATQCRLPLELVSQTMSCFYRSIPSDRTTSIYDDMVAFFPPLVLSSRLLRFRCARSSLSLGLIVVFRWLALFPYPPHQLRLCHHPTIRFLLSFPISVAWMTSPRCVFTTRRMPDS